MPVKPGYLALICVLAVVAVNAFALSAELKAGEFDVNDSVLHYTLADRMVQEKERGETPRDFWLSKWTFGYPVAKPYQTLGLPPLFFFSSLLEKPAPFLPFFFGPGYPLVFPLP